MVVVFRPACWKMWISWCIYISSFISHHTRQEICSIPPSNLGTNALKRVWSYFISIPLSTNSFYKGVFSESTIMTDWCHISAESPSCTWPVLLLEISINAQQCLMKSSNLGMANLTIFKTSFWTVSKYNSTV